MRVTRVGTIEREPSLVNHPKTRVDIALRKVVSGSAPVNNGVDTECTEQAVQYNNDDAGLAPLGAWDGCRRLIAPSVFSITEPDKQHTQLLGYVR